MHDLHSPCNRSPMRAILQSLPLDVNRPSMQASLGPVAASFACTQALRPSRVLPNRKAPDPHNLAYFGWPMLCLGAVGGGGHGIAHGRLACAGLQADRRL